MTDEAKKRIAMGLLGNSNLGPGLLQQAVPQDYSRGLLGGGFGGLSAYQGPAPVNWGQRVAPNERKSIAEVMYPQGWKGGFLGMGNILAQAVDQQANERAMMGRVRTENRQRGKENSFGAEAKAALLAQSPFENPVIQQLFTPGGIGKVVYHGTPAKFAPTPSNPFGEFNASFINRGEGNQAYGQGTYLAESKDVAQKYREQLAGPSGGSVYKAEIPDEGFLPWDQPVANAPDVMKALGLPPEAGAQTGQQIYEALWRNIWKNHIKETKNNPKPGFDPRKVASEQLREKGINGIQYLDSQSRGLGSGTTNYVLFDPSKARITGVE